MTKIRWRSGPAIKQNFPFHDNLIYYISMNPSSSKGYSQIIQSCKYFFEVNPILVVEKMGRDSIFSNETCTKKFCIQKMSCKFWILSKLLLCYADENFISTLLPKLYKSEIKELAIHDTTFTFKNLEILGSTVESFHLTNVCLTYENGEKITFEEIMKTLPNVKTITYGFAKSEFTVKNFAVLENLREITLCDLTESFKITDFHSFSKQHKKIDFELYYKGTKMPRDYLDRLDAIIEFEKHLPDSNIFIMYKNWALNLYPTFGDDYLPRRSQVAGGKMRVQKTRGRVAKHQMRSAKTS